MAYWAARMTAATIAGVVLLAAPLHETRKAGIIVRGN
jgi:hypothetical protein